MLKKFTCTMALGAGLMWFADPASGADRRARAARVLRPLLDRAGAARRRAKPRDVTRRDITGDPTTITEFVELARRHGVSGEMDISDERIVCTTCGSASEVESMERLWLHRFEGATNPDDMSTVSALRCPSCETVGLLITGYGPNASAEEADVVVRLPQPRDGSAAPFISAAT